MKKILLATLLIAGLATSTWAAGLDSLEKFIKSVRAGRAEFVQIVTAPAKEGQTARTKKSTGTFEFLRPGRFKFVYKKPFENYIVADGQTLWLYDVDLNQVSARKQSQALGSTPAALIASASDLASLRADFVLTEAPDAEGLEWVLATPKAKDSGLQTVRVGFKGDELVALDILDSFGQLSTMRFQGLNAPVSLDAAAFQFKPPAGADLIRQ
ncbi:MAG: outer membrane lipoprotein carrier protein LolA [Burkholderiales bacterium PBB3]|nr:MAG: outer membrane lipoprotein carrier protein LolA [Burkholderiales bacterium PBB3]